MCAQQFPIRHLGLNNGLSNNSATAVYQDESGYMWFGTFNGLNRYDGRDFKVYRNNPKDMESLPGSAVNCITGDSDNNLWIGCSNGPAVFNNTRTAFRTLTYRDQDKVVRPLTVTTHQIVHLKHKNLTLLATKSMLAEFKNPKEPGCAVTLMGKTDYWARGLSFDEQHNIFYVFVNNVGLCTYKPLSAKLEVLDRTLNFANCLMFDNGHLWIGSDEGLYRYNIKEGTYSANLFDQKRIVRDLLKTGQTLYVATDGNGVYTVADRSLAPVVYSPNATGGFLESKAVYDVYKSSSGELWFATLRGGVSMIGARPLYFDHFKNTYPGSTEQARNFIMSFCEDRERNLWIGTEGAGLYYWDRKSNLYTAYTSASSADKRLKSDFVTSIVRGSDDAIWVAMWKGGVCRIEPGSGRITNFSIYNPYTQKPEQESWLLYKDKQEGLWLAATNEGALYRYDPVKKNFVIYDPKLIDVTCMLQTHEGLIWGGTLNSIICIDPARHTSRSFPISYNVRCVLEDRRNRLWFGCADGGLLLFDRKKGNYIRYTTDNGLSNNTIFRLLEDSKGHLWMSTFEGLSMFNPETLEFKNFFVPDGLQSNQFNWNAGIKLSDGTMAFGGINGFNIFTPEKVADYHDVREILLNGFIVDNKPLTVNSPFVKTRNLERITGVELPYNKGTFSFEFVYLDYINADKINFAYSLEGWDKEWNFVGKNRRANYSQLKEGDYIFRVKALDINGKEIRSRTLVHIHILPPWYRTWWAFACYFILAVGAVYAYIAYSRNKERLRYEVKLARLERLKEKELTEKQLSMFTFIAHELRSPLSLIINPLKHAISQETGKKSNVDLTVAYRNARRLLGLTDQLLLFRKADSDADILKLSTINLNALCSEVYQFFVYRAGENSLEFTLNLPEDTVSIVGDFEKLEIAVFNILSNAFKFTPKSGKITFTLKVLGDSIAIVITDTGRGIAALEIDTIFEKFRQSGATSGADRGFGIGLFVARHFISKHHGTITCVSKPGEGSTFTISLPKAQEHFGDVPYDDHNFKSSGFVEELLAAQETLVGDPAGEEMPLHNDVGEEVISQKKSLVVVDDNPEMKKYLVNLFSEKYIVSGADDGNTGLALIKKVMPDIIVSDITMEGLNGIELCRAVKQNEALSHIPLILLTATTTPESQLKGLTEGADDYITKPFDNELLLARVEAILRGRSQLRKYFLDSITLSESSNKVPEEYREFLQRCIEIVEKNLTNKDFSLKNFSSQMGMSHSSLYKKIKTISGQTAAAFIRSIRLRRGAVLLLTENYTIAQVGSLVGIDDSRYFREQFSKVFGMTPSQYIKKYKTSFNRDLNIIQR